MNAFESIVEQYLEAKGYWVRHSVKVGISKQEKKKIGMFSMPTPEIDLVALNAGKNEMILIEAKSFLDSYGVYIEAFTDKKDQFKSLHRMFTDPTFRRIVTRVLRADYLKKGLINRDTRIRYGLAAGKIHQGDEEELMEHFSRKGWILFTPRDIKMTLSQLSAKVTWEDDLVTMTAKLLLRSK